MIETSESTTKLWPALFKALKEMPNPTFNQDGQIQSRTYQYADLAAVNTAIKPHLFANGLMVIQPITLATVVTMIVHTPSGEWIRSAASLPTTVPSMQAYGSNVTYLRRYLLCALCAIVGDGDDDGATGTGYPQGYAAPPPAATPPPPQGNHNAATPAADTPPKSTFRDTMVEVTKKLQAALKESGVRSFKKTAGDIIAQVVAECGGGTLEQSMDASRDVQKAIYKELTARVDSIIEEAEIDKAAAKDDD